ncbi:hypothetical protein ES703_72134 [subsurface metagenome]
MPRIPCPLCDKTFKGESGLHWHLSNPNGPHVGMSSAAIEETIQGVVGQPKPPPKENPPQEGVEEAPPEEPAPEASIGIEPIAEPEVSVESEATPESEPEPPVEPEHEPTPEPVSEISIEPKLVPEPESTPEPEVITTPEPKVITTSKPKPRSTLESIPRVPRLTRQEGDAIVWGLKKVFTKRVLVVVICLAIVAAVGYFWYKGYANRHQQQLQAANPRKLSSGDPVRDFMDNL